MLKSIHTPEDRVLEGEVEWFQARDQAARFQGPLVMDPLKAMFLRFRGIREKTRAKVYQRGEGGSYERDAG